MSSDPRLQLLSESETYREFLKRYFSGSNPSGKKVSFSEFSATAGFKARSFPRDVVMGKKKITPRSLPKFQTALKLNRDLSRLFEILVKLAEPSCRAAHETEKSLQRAKASLCKRVHSRPDPSRFPIDTKNFSLHSLPPVYAALGSESGATIEEIRNRTGMTTFDVKLALSKLMENKAAMQNGTRYRATQSHFFIEMLEENDFFKTYFQSRAQQSISGIERNFRSDEHLFFTSDFSVDRRKIPELKQALKQLLLQFVDQSEKPEGDRIVSITANFGMSFAD